jgi:hypothetical protein
MPALSRRKRFRSRRFAGWSHTEIHSRRSMSSVALRALDQLCAGVIVTDNTGLVIETNRAAEAIVGCGDGLLVREGRLCARRVFETARVAKLIEGATGEQTRMAGGRLVIGRCEDLPPYVLAVMPLRAAPVDDRRLAMIIIVDPTRYVPSETDLADLFGLSPAETRVAAALMTGKSLADIAAVSGPDTVQYRYQLLNVPIGMVVRCGTRRRTNTAELRRLVVSTWVTRPS